MNLAMSDLKRGLEAAGFTEVKTLLSSGNAVFTARAAPAAAIGKKVEAALQKALGKTFMAIVRPVDELRDLIERDPYRKFRLPAAAKRVVTFLRKAGNTPKLPIELHGARILCVEGGEVFSFYVPGPKGPVFMALIEKTFGKDVTTRTWDTVRKAAR
jgi:uncharacterized protein (DUF1697 family)